MSSTLTGGRVRALALVGAGGFTGAILRWSIDGWLGSAPAFGSAFPIGTLAANVLASFLLGIVLSEGHVAGRVGVETRLLVGTGFCGSLSTYSTFAAETAAATPAVAGTYVVATYVLGFAAIVAGNVVARWWS